MHYLFKKLQLKQTSPQCPFDELQYAGYVTTCGYNPLQVT
jgi:hypothetical protein